ncbi:MAG: hypothetical protein ABRQ28_07335 [Smithellaceae bacterium]
MDEAQRSIRLFYEAVKTAAFFNLSTAQQQERLLPIIVKNASSFIPRQRIIKWILKIP